MSDPIRVVLFQVRQPNDKIAALANMAAYHFERKERFAIFVEDDKTIQFVDELLWKYPPTSFLPHAVESDAPVAISKSKQNINQARFAFNLCATPLLFEGPFRAIYDFEDLSSPSKQQLSALRFDAYKKAGWLIEAR